MAAAGRLDEEEDVGFDDSLRLEAGDAGARTRFRKLVRGDGRRATQEQLPQSIASHTHARQSYIIVRVRPSTLLYCKVQFYLYTFTPSI